MMNTISPPINTNPTNAIENIIIGFAFISSIRFLIIRHTKNKRKSVHGEIALQHSLLECIWFFLNAALMMSSSS